MLQTASADHCIFSLQTLINMYSLVVLSALVAVAVAGPAPGLVAAAPLATPLLAPALPATLLPRVAVAPATTTIVKSPYIVDQPTPVLRSVPVPLRAVSYAAPSVIAAPYAAPSIIASPYASPLAYSAPLLGSAYGAPIISDSLLLKK